MLTTTTAGAAPRNGISTGPEFHLARRQLQQQTRNHGSPTRTALAAAVAPEPIASGALVRRPGRIRLEGSLGRVPPAGGSLRRAHLPAADGSTRRGVQHGADGGGHARTAEFGPGLHQPLVRALA